LQARAVARIILPLYWNIGTVHFCKEMNHAAIDRFFERAILVFVLAILVFAPVAMAAVSTREFLVVQGLMMAVMFLWALRILFNPRIQFSWPPVCWVVLAFALYAVARYFTADIEYVARQEMIQTLMYAFLFFAIVNNLTAKEPAQIIAFTLIFLAAGISGYATWQFLTRSDRVWNVISTYTGRASGTFYSPNNFACFLEMLLPLALAYLLAGRIRPLTRIFLGYAALAMGAGLAMTFSRGGWLAGAAGIITMLAILMCHRKHRLPALVLLFALVVVGTVFIFGYLSHTVSYFKRIEAPSKDIPVDLEYRVQMWQAAENMWEDHFWFGVGPAHYDYRFRQYRPESVQQRPDRAHNDYLNLLADWGTVGGIIVVSGMLLFAAGLVKTGKAVRPDPDDFGRGMSNRFAFFAGATAALLALALHSMVDFNLHIPANALLGTSLLALLTAQLQAATGRSRFDAKWPVKILTIAILAGGISYLGWQGYRRGEENYWVERADNTDLPLLERADLLQKAFAIEPQNFNTTYAIAEFYRMQSFQGGSDYETLAQTAMEWYRRGMKLNPYDGYNDMGYGMCLDWLGRHDEAETYFQQAEALDPNGYFMVANIGWYYVQVGDYQAARVWLQRSLRLRGDDDNVIGHTYWEIVQDRLTRDARGEHLLPPGF
jgi:O-antigen ligase